ncbi:Toh1 protein [Maudiozyma humilis]|uniref:glucan endo-1,3-beta-D-glucosidase n=1 Tax=Maudiozyma humilis TaxID=51915 RepID=A0AAV5S388_MAUHU|nr:Toh1 protein [Kazachstania humilis]
MQLSNALLAATALLASGASAQEAYDELSFTNVGFAGTYFPVKKLSDVTSDKCSCEVADATWFSGTNAPLADHLSVHFRGPLSLSKFGFYTSDSFSINNNRSSSDWTREAYYDASSQTSDNVTFLTKAGASSPCLGNALSYASSNGTGAASSSTILASDNYISSDEEFSIFSTTACPKSGLKKGCGVYRSGIPAFYGFGGTTKMFLFEFKMPTESQKNSSSFEYYDMPAIWLLNDHIPRTSQYPTNTNCSCWSSGCGEFDIFEVMNGTERNHLYSTFHTFQGIEDLGTGIQSFGYIPRDTSSTMLGGVIFDSSGNTVTFISNSTSLDSTITYDQVNKWLSSISKDEMYSTQLATISATAPTTTSKSNAISFSRLSSDFKYYLFAISAGVAQLIM